IAGGLTSFQIAPDLTHYDVTATNHITQIQIPGLSSFAGGAAVPLQFGQFSGAPTGNPYAIAWNETVVDASGSHDQVEVVIFDPVTAQITSRTTFQIASGGPQNVRLAFFGNLVVLGYGDNTGTHLVEFNSSGALLASIFDPTTRSFGQLFSLGDGRFSITYN